MVLENSRDNPFGWGMSVSFLNEEIQMMNIPGGPFYSVISQAVLVRFARLALIMALMLCLVLPVGALAEADDPVPWPELCIEGELGSTQNNPPDFQKILTCVPPNWNGILIIYAHGFVPPQEELALPVEELSRFVQDDQSAVDVLLSMGFAFATTSYSQNGWAIEAASTDLNALVKYFKKLVPKKSLQKVLLLGASEGGLVTTMQVEQYPDIYGGGLALCGVVGGAPYQVKYLGDFRVVYDYFYPDVFNFGVVNVPDDAYEDWPAYADAIAAGIVTYPNSARQLFNVTNAAQDPTDLAGSWVTTSLADLGYSIFETPDLLDKAGGNPYSNIFTWYHGSDNDWRLNRGVERVWADRVARDYMRDYYQTTGNLQVPLVTLHNFQDPDVPFMHELIYFTLVALRGHLNNLVAIPVPGYGHCNFTFDQVLTGFGLLLQKVRFSMTSSPSFMQATLPQQLTEQDVMDVDLSFMLDNKVYLPITVQR
jgi:pimeloyl-ACP methyl ester carboxylesterase